MNKQIVESKCVSQIHSWSWVKVSKCDKQNTHSGEPMFKQNSGEDMQLTVHLATSECENEKQTFPSV